MQLSQYQNDLLSKWAKIKNFTQVSPKTTICVLTLGSGFEVIGRSSCENPAHYDKNIGEFFALLDAIEKLDELSAFYRAESNVGVKEQKN